MSESHKKNMAERKNIVTHSTNQGTVLALKEAKIFSKKSEIIQRKKINPICKLVKRTNGALR